MWAARSDSSAAAAALRTSASWASPNQPPSLSACPRIRWSCGAIRETRSSAWRKRSGSERASTAASTSSSVNRGSATCADNRWVVRLTTLSHGAGCACKLPAAELHPLVAELPRIDDPNVLVGAETADDAAVYRVSDELAVVTSVDFFTPIVDDPFDFGRIAAANALSDLYAMGATPITALNLVAWSLESLGGGALRELLRGGADMAGAAGAAVVGGHSIDDPEPKYGMAVTG